MTKQLNSYDRIPDYENGSYFSTKAEDLQEWADRAGVTLEEWCFYQATFRHVLGKIDRGADKFNLKDCLLEIFKSKLEKADVKKTD